MLSRFVEMGVRLAHKTIPTIRFVNFTKQDGRGSWPLEGRLRIAWDDRVFHAERRALRFGWNLGVSHLWFEFAAGSIPSVSAPVDD